MCVSSILLCLSMFGWLDLVLVQRTKNKVRNVLYGTYISFIFTLCVLFIVCCSFVNLTYEESFPIIIFITFLSAFRCSA